MIFYAVLWCINPGFSCSREFCKTWSDYISDSNKCRTNGAVDYKTITFFSALSFTGLSNLYMGNSLSGFCELFNFILTIISISAVCNYYDSFKRRYDNDALCAAGFVGTGIAILHLIKAIHMVATESAEITEIAVMILSLIIVCVHCAENDTQRSHRIVITTQITVLTVALETMRDVYMIWYDGRDGYGCPFV